MITVEWFAFAGVVLFCASLFAFVIRRDLVGSLVSVAAMLLAILLALTGFARFWGNSEGVVGIIVLVVVAVILVLATLVIRGLDVRIHS